mgnify:CR=1 FL=1
MVVHYLDISRTVGCPDKADPEFLVESDAMLPAPISLERLKMVAQRQKHSAQRNHSLQLIKLSPSGGPELARAHMARGTRIDAVENVLSPSVRERPDRAGERKSRDILV